jgi:hypothetical protein
MAPLPAFQLLRNLFIIFISEIVALHELRQQSVSFFGLAQWILDQVTVLKTS